MGNITDLAVARDDEGIYDLVIDPVSMDFKTTDGLESCLFVSLFSDRRARDDEVADPMKRRGWIGNLLADVPGDNFGSGLWLYEQRRMTQDVVASLNIEAQQSLEWMLDQDDGLARSVSSEIGFDAASRTVSIIVTIVEVNGDTTTHVYPLIEATKTGLLATGV